MVVMGAEDRVLANKRAEDGAQRRKRRLERNAIPPLGKGRKQLIDCPGDFLAGQRLGRVALRQPELGEFYELRLGGGVDRHGIYVVSSASWATAAGYPANGSIERRRRRASAGDRPSPSRI